MTTAPFNPSPSLQAQLLDDFSNPTLSLRDIAAAHKTTLTALSAFISRPDIQALLDIRKDVASERVQLIALDHLPPAIAAASSVLAAFHSEEAALKPDPATLAKRQDPAADYRARRTALYSASLLFRLSRPIAHRPSPRPAQERHRAREANVTDNSHSTPPHIPLDLAALEQLVSQLEALDLPQHAEPNTQPATQLSVAPSADPAAVPALDLPEPGSASQISDLRLEIPTVAPPSPTNRAQSRRASHLTTLAGLAPGP